MWYQDTLYWKIMESIGLDNLIGEIIARKFELVYKNWIIAVLMISLAFLGFILNCRAKIELGKKIEFAIGTYVVLGGFLFFNSPILTHSMFQWNKIQFVKSVFWSIGISSFPIVVLYFILRNRNQQIKEKKIAFFLIIPILHTLMSIIYMISPFVGVE